MKKVIKQAVGIDCGKDELVISISSLYEDFQVKNEFVFSVSNDTSGFRELVAQALKFFNPGISLQFIVEATGVYHQQVACYLTGCGYKISVVLPTRAAHFMRTLKLKTINDKVSSSALALMGLEKKLDTWQMPEPVLNQLKNLCRERAGLLAESTSLKNQLHALTSGAWDAGQSVKRIELRLELAKTQLLEIETEMKTIIAANPALKKRFDNVCTIKGVGLITAVTVVAETNGFNHIRNQRQLVSYAGLDVISKQSGTSINTPGRISHRGNVHIRRALHFPALSAIRSDLKMKERYANLLIKHNIKMKAVVAIQRKLLVLVYTLWKKNEPYNPKFLEQSKETALTELAHGCS